MASVFLFWPQRNGEGARDKEKKKIKPIGTVSNKKLWQICHTISLLIKFNGLSRDRHKRKHRFKYLWTWKYLEIALILHLSVLYLLREEMYFLIHIPNYFWNTYVKQTEVLQDRFGCLQQSFHVVPINPILKRKCSRIYILLQFFMTCEHWNL